MSGIKDDEVVQTLSADRAAEPARRMDSARGLRGAVRSGQRSTQCLKGRPDCPALSRPETNRVNVRWPRESRAVAMVLAPKEVNLLTLTLRAESNSHEVERASPQESPHWGN
jgi:hypothetical protein